MRCPRPQCDMRGVPAGVRGHLVLVHGFSRTEADAITDNVSDNYTQIGERNMNGQNIKEARKAAGFTQAELAEELGVSDATIYGWEKDKCQPNKTNKKALRDLLFDGSATESEEMEREKELPADDSVDTGDEGPSETDQKQVHDKEPHADEAESEQAEPDACTCKGCDCDDDAEGQGITEEDRQQLLNRGFKTGLQHAMLNAKEMAIHCFWNGDMEEAVQLKRFHSLLSRRVRKMEA